MGRYRGEGTVVGKVLEGFPRMNPAFILDTTTRSDYLFYEFHRAKEVGLWNELVRTMGLVDTSWTED